MASVWSYLDLCSSQLANKLYTPTTPKVQHDTPLSTPAGRALYNTPLSTPAGGAPYGTSRSTPAGADRDLWPRVRGGGLKNHKNLAVISWNGKSLLLYIHTEFPTESSKLCLFYSQISVTFVLISYLWSNQWHLLSVLLLVLPTTLLVLPRLIHSGIISMAGCSDIFICRRTQLQPPDIVHSSNPLISAVSAHQALSVPDGGQNLCEILHEMDQRSTAFTLIHSSTRYWLAQILNYTWSMFLSSDTVEDESKINCMTASSWLKVIT